MPRYWIETTMDAGSGDYSDRYWCEVWDTRTGEVVFTTTSYYLKADARKEAALWVRSRELPSHPGDA